MTQDELDKEIKNLAQSIFDSRKSFNEVVEPIIKENEQAIKDLEIQLDDAEKDAEDAEKEFFAAVEPTLDSYAATE